MRFSKRKMGGLILALAAIVPLISAIDKSLPLVRSKESFRSCFPKKEFQAKLNKITPQWMLDQIESDLQEFQQIDREAVATTYRHIQNQVDQKRSFHHYRILDNKLYKYIPPDRHFSPKDSPLEMALKTLLVQAKVPDVDFLLCEMDGMPEGYMPKHFYISENQSPILAKAKLKEPATKYIVLIPDQFSLSDDWSSLSKEIIALNGEIRWEEKKGKAHWRGGFSDGGTPNGAFLSHFKECPRYRISKLSTEFPEKVDAGLNWVSEREITEILGNEKLIKASASKKEQLFCKYLPVLDGHMCTYPGYQWRLLSNSVCFKQDSDQVQWFYAALKPYVHYVPIKNDMSDLIEKIQWAEANEEKILEISRNAQDFALNHLLLEDNYLYLYHVFQKYASLQRIDFEALKKETANDPCWKCIQYRKRLALVKSFDKLVRLVFF